MTHNLLPNAAQRILRQSSMFEPAVGQLHSPKRRAGIDEAIATVSMQYPHLFKYRCNAPTASTQSAASTRS